MLFIVISLCLILDQPRHFIFDQYLPPLDSLSTLVIFVTFKQLKFTYHIILHSSLNVWLTFVIVQRHFFLLYTLGRRFLAS